MTALWNNQFQTKIERENTMNELKQLEEVLATKESKLVKKQAWLDEVGMGKLDPNNVEEMKLAEKRIKVRREISELISDIKILKEIIAE
jgi:hypothetical protein